MAKIGEIVSPGTLHYGTAADIVFPNGVPEDTQRRWDEAMAYLDESERRVLAMPYKIGPCATGHALHAQTELAKE